MLRHLLSGQVDVDLKRETMSGQPMEYAWHQPPSSSVTGTSELFSSTFAMLSDTNGAYPEQWAENNKPAVSQSFLFDQPTGYVQQPMSIFEPTNARYDNHYGYRSPQQYVHSGAIPQQFAQPIPQPRPIYHPQYQQVAQHYYQQQPVGRGIPVTHATLQRVPLVQPQQQAHQVLRPEPINPIVEQRPHSSSQTPASRQTSAASTVSPSEDASMNSPDLTSSGSVASCTPPLGSDVISTDLEGPDEERVMCMACRGVYPSRRSLTGHIGRNEKCREIIGRNYLDQVASGANPQMPGTESAIKSGAITNGHDGMSPVCPYCDRFISHYKGNIRRHINQCCKNGGEKRPRPDKEKLREKKRRKTDDPLNIELNDGYEPGTALSCSMLSSPPLSPTSSFYTNGDFIGSTNGHFNGNYISSSHASEKPNGSAKKDSSGPPDDAYICDDCDFVTVYKGNMKRHLNTCHTVPDCKNLKEWDRKLESMRASAMGIYGDELQKKLTNHKQNSTRGRKPRNKKKEDKNSSEESEPMTDYEPNSNSNFEYNLSF